MLIEANGGPGPGSSSDLPPSRSNSSASSSTDSVSLGHRFSRNRSRTNSDNRTAKLDSLRKHIHREDRLTAGEIRNIPEWLNAPVSHEALLGDPSSDFKATPFSFREFSFGDEDRISPSKVPVILTALLVTCAVGGLLYRNSELEEGESDLFTWLTTALVIILGGGAGWISNRRAEAAARTVNDARYKEVRAAHDAARASAFERHQSNEKVRKIVMLREGAQRRQEVHSRRILDGKVEWLVGGIVEKMIQRLSESTTKGSKGVARRINRFVNNGTSSDSKLKRKLADRVSRIAGRKHEKAVGSGGFGDVTRIGGVALKRLEAERLRSVEERRDASTTFHGLAASVDLNRLPGVIGAEGILVERSDDSSIVPYEVMRFLKAPNLYEGQKLIQTFSEKQLIQFMAWLITIVEAIHDEGYVHRDLKPYNVLMQKIKSKGNAAPFVPLVIDLDGAKWLPEVDGKPGTTSEWYGTRSFAAPEVSCGQPYGKEVDWYSIGMTMIGIYALWGQNLHSSKKANESDEEAAEEEWWDMMENYLTEGVDDARWGRSFSGPVEHIFRKLVEAMIKEYRSDRLTDPSAIKASPLFADVDWNRPN